MNAQKVRTLLTVAAIVGVGGTAVCAIYDAKHEDENKPKWKSYWRTGVTAAVTMGCIGSSHKIGTKQVATIAATAAGAKQLYDRYENKLKELVGEDKIKEVKRELTKDRAKEKLAKSQLLPAEGDEEFFYEPITDQWFYSTREKIVIAQNKMCNRLIHDPSDFESKENQCVMAGIFIKDWLEAIGCEPPRKGMEQIGWFWGDGDGYWDYNWGFFGGPWISVTFEEIYEGNDKYTMLDYGPMPPTFPDSEGAIVPYRKELTEAKMRWENEYA